MKFKKSHILIISLISLFLLLSISSVSAASDADNIAQEVIIDDVSASGDIDNIDNDIIDVNILSEGENTDPENPDEPGTGENTGDETGTPTAIEASNNTYSFGEDIKINVSVKDNENNVINNITKDNLIVSYKNESAENYTNMNFTLDNESRIVFEFDLYKTLPVGNYTVKIQFINSTIDGIKYIENETFSTLNITKADTTINASDVKVQLGGPYLRTKQLLIPLTVKLNDANKTLSFNKNNITVAYIVDDEGEIVWYYNCTNQSGGGNITHTILLSNFNLTEVGNYTLMIIFKGTDNTNPSNTNITLSILENNTIQANGTIKVNNSAKDNVSIPFNITNTNIVNITDEETGENKTRVDVTNLTVDKADLILNLTYNNGTENITVLLADDKFGLSGEPGNYTLNLNLSDFDFKVDLYKVNLTIIYKYGDFNETNKTINLIAFTGAHIEDNVTEADYQFGGFKFRLLDENNQPIANYTITVTLSNGDYFYSSIGSGYAIVNSYKDITSDEDGWIIINNTFISNDDKPLTVGKHNFTFNGKEFFQFNNTSEVTVNPINVKIINANNITKEYGNIFNYTFQVVRAETGEPINHASIQFKIVSPYLNKTLNKTTNSTGWYTSPDLNLIAGVYNITLNVLDSNLNCTTKNVKKYINVTQRTPILTASNRTIYYNSDYSAIVKLTDKKTGKVVQNAYVWLRVFTGSKYSDFIGKTDKNGKLYLRTPLDVGKHKIIYKCIDNNYKASSITRYLTVKKATGQFSAASVTTYYRSGKYFQIKLTNTKTKKAMYYSKVNIKVYITKNSYYNYTGTTDANGIVKLKVTYKPGTYKAIIGSADKGYSANSITRQIKVTKSPIKIAPTALTVKRGNYFKVKVISTKTNKTISSVNVKVKVYTGKTYKTYTIKTNSKGIASLKISQSVGKHKVVLSPGSPAYYSATAITRTLTVTR